MAFRARELQIFVRIILSSPCQFMLKVVQGCVHAANDRGKKGERANFEERVSLIRFSYQMQSARPQKQSIESRALSVSMLADMVRPSLNHCERRKKRARTETHRASLTKPFGVPCASSLPVNCPHACSSSRRASNALLDSSLRLRPLLITAEDPGTFVGRPQGVHYRTENPRSSS